jgi:hypothetical protein
MEHEEEWARLTQRDTDYNELLRFGEVIRRVDDPDDWRAEIKVQARADKIKVRTGTANSDNGVVWAYLRHLDDREIPEEEMRATFERGRVSGEAIERAALRGHNVPRILRAEGTQAASVCVECGARLYVDTSTSPPLMEGEVFDNDCPS